MNHSTTRSKLRLLSALLIPITVGLSGPVFGEANLQDIYEVADQINNDAVESNARVGELSDEAQSLFLDYKAKLRVIEGLRAYNTQLQRQINDQEDVISKIDKSMDEVEITQRQITPLILKMIEGLEQHIEHDLPFLLESRRNNVERLRTIMDRGDVSASEKYSQVLRAYQIENEMGRTLEVYSDSIEIDGSERIVDVLRVGRLALLYQTSDGSETGWFNPENRTWESLDRSYTIPVRNGLKMARKQLSSGLFSIPIVAPGD